MHLSNSVMCFQKHPIVYYVVLITIVLAAVCKTHFSNNIIILYVNYSNFIR